MSELIKNNDNRATIRWKLLTSVSALALTVSSVGIAHAEDADRPLVWIELGGQAENISGQGEVYAPGFLSAYSTSSILQEKLTPLQAQRPPLFSAGEEAKISFQPEGSDWVRLSLGALWPLRQQKGCPSSNRPSALQNLPQRSPGIRGTDLYPGKIRRLARLSQ